MTASEHMSLEMSVPTSPVCCPLNCLVARHQTLFSPLKSDLVCIVQIAAAAAVGCSAAAATTCAATTYAPPSRADTSVSVPTDSDWTRMVARAHHWMGTRTRSDAAMNSSDAKPADDACINCESTRYCDCATAAAGECSQASPLNSATT